MQKYLVNTAGMYANVASGISDGCAVFSCWCSRYSARYPIRLAGAHLLYMFWRTSATLFTVPPLRVAAECDVALCRICFSDARY